MSRKAAVEKVPQWRKRKKPQIESATNKSVKLSEMNSDIIDDAVRKLPYLLQLPSETIVKICSYLDVRTYVMLSRVCHVFYRIVATPQVWKNIVIDCSFIIRAKKLQYKEVFVKCNYLINHMLDTRKITLIGLADINLDKMLNYFKNLEELHIIDSDFFDGSSKQNIKCILQINSNFNLKVLCITNSVFSSSFFQESTRKFYSLHYLKFVSCPGLDIHSVDSFIRNTPNLQLIEIKSCYRLERLPYEAIDIIKDKGYSTVTGQSLKFIHDKIECDIEPN